MRILALMMLMVIGCGKTEQPVNTDENKSTTAKPVRGKLADQAVGTYESNPDKFEDWTLVLAEDGTGTLRDGQVKGVKTSWKVADDKIHVIIYAPRGEQSIFFNVGNNGDLNCFRVVLPDGRQRDMSFTLKKIK